LDAMLHEVRFKPVHQTCCIEKIVLV